MKVYKHNNKVHNNNNMIKKNNYYKNNKKNKLYKVKIKERKWKKMFLNKAKAQAMQRKVIMKS